MVKLLESSVQVMLSLPSVFQQLKVCQFGSLDLDYILDQGDQLIKSLKVNHPLGNGAIFSCAGFSCALIWTKKSMFGTHSRNSQGVLIPNGQSVLLEFRSITALNLFIMKYYKKNCDSTSTLQCGT